MILRNNQDEILQIGDLKGKEVELSLDDKEKILYMLSQGNYKHPRNSGLRESVSNAIDAQIEFGVDPLEKPVIVGLDYKKLWIKDSGIGIDNKRMEIIRKYGASTKDNRDDLFGCFGIGFYANLSYTQQFTVESNHDGTKRVWLISKNGIKNEIIPISEEKTDEENGTTIIVPIKNDYREWKEVINETLLYFKGVIIENEDLLKVNNYKLYEGKNFLYRENCSINDLHIVLDQVIYTLNWSDLGLSTISFPFGIKFGLNEGLIPTPSREEIILMDDTKELIRERLKSTILELNELVHTKKCNLYEYLSESSYHYTFNIGEVSVYIEKFAYNKLCHEFNIDQPNTDYTSLNENFKLIPQRRLNFLLKPYKHVGTFDWRGRFSKKHEGSVTDTLKGVIVVDETLNSSKVEFLKTLPNIKNTKLVKFSRSSIGLHNYKNYNGLGIGIKDHTNKLEVSKDKWRDCIIAWQQEEDVVLNSLPKLSDYRHDYEEWLKNKPKKIRVSSLGVKEDDDITIKFPAMFDVNNSTFNMKFEPKFVKVSSLNKKFYIYSTEREEVNKLYDLWRNQKNIIPIMVNKTEVYKIRDLKNCISYEEFAKGKTRYAQKWVSAWLIYQDIINDKLLKKLFYKSYINTFQYIDTVSDFASVHSINRNTNQSKYNKHKTFIQGEINTIVKYLNSWNSSSLDSDFVKGVVETYTKLGLVDVPVLRQWENLKKKLSYYDALLYLKEDEASFKFVDEIVLLKKKNEMYQRQINKFTQELNNCKSNNNG